MFRIIAAVKFIWPLLFLLPICGLAQEASQSEISGRLIDSQTQAPIIGASVFTPDKRSSALSDGNGVFTLSFKTLPERLIVSHVNYADTISSESFEIGKTIRIPLEAISFQISHAVATGFSRQTYLKRLPSPVSLIQTPVIERGDQLSLVQALNSVPGVKMEERGYGGSRRINIRSSFIRSPFAVRNIKMYLDGIPLSSPDGSSPLELIDLADIREIEVIKGPAGSLYGAGTGGVLLFKSKRAPNSKLEIDSKVTAGSFNLLRTSSSLASNAGDWNIRVSHHHQETEGYRDQEYNRKDQYNLFIRRNGSKARQSLYSTYYDGVWALPGGISTEQVNEDPTAAREFSETINARVTRQRLRVGLTQDLSISDRISSVTSMYMNTTDKINPYGTSPFFNGFKDESATGFGLRTVFNYLIPIGNAFEIRAALGGEYQNEVNYLDEFDLGNAVVGDLKYSLQTTSESQLIFLNLDADVSESTLIELGLSYSASPISTVGNTFVDDQNIDLDTSLFSKGYWLPRLAISQKIIDEWFLHTSYSRGASQPSLFELVDVSSGTLNTHLNAEIGDNYEAGIKGSVSDGRLSIDLSVYVLELRNTIIPYGDSFFLNSGRSKYQGIELSINGTVVDENEALLSGLWLTSTVTINNYTFISSDLVDPPLTGNQLPGTPLASISNLVHLEIAKNLRIELSHYWYDRTPLNNSNSDWAPAYNLLNGKMSYGKEVGKFSFQAFVGVNNITDTKYSSFLALNAFGGRYFNPSPERNYFGGLGLKYRL